MNDDLDKIIEELKDEEVTQPSENKSEAEGLNDDNVNEFIIKKMGSLVENGLNTLESIQGSIVAGLDPEEMAAYSSLVQSIVKAADTLNKINTTNKKIKSAKEIKAMEIENKKLLPPKTGNTTNILVATREEILKQFSDVDIKRLSEKDIIASEPDYGHTEYTEFEETGEVKIDEDIS